MVTKVLWRGFFSLNGQSPLICQPFINYVYLISTDDFFQQSTINIYFKHLLNSSLVFNFIGLFWALFRFCPKQKFPGL